MRPGHRGSRQQQDHGVQERQVKRIERMNGARRPNRLSIPLGFRKYKEVEIGPEETDEEHDLAADEQGHAVAQAELHDRAMGAGRARLAHHVSPPEEHRRQHGDRPKDEEHVVPEVRGQDDTEQSHEAAEGSDDRPRAGIREMIGMLQPGIRKDRPTVRFAAHAIPIPTPPGKPPRPGCRLFAKSRTNSRWRRVFRAAINSASTFLQAPPLTSARRAAPLWRGRQISRHRPTNGKTYRTG